MPEMVESNLQEYSTEQISEHNSDKSAWIILDSKVYDVTKFLLEHPGGENVILEHAGRDATDGFNDVGHSSDARQLAEDYLIGVVPQHSEMQPKAGTTKINQGVTESWSDVIFSSTWTNLIIPVAISVTVLATYKIVQKIIYNVQ